MDKIVRLFYDLSSDAYKFAASFSLTRFDKRGVTVFAVEVRRQIANLRKRLDEIEKIVEAESKQIP